MAKKTKTKKVWVLFVRDLHTIVVGPTRASVLHDQEDCMNQGHTLCTNAFEELLGFMPTKPTKLTISWEQPS